MPQTIRIALHACAWMLFAIPAFPNQTIGLPPDTGQGNPTPFGGYSGRFQQVYSASAFSGAIAKFFWPQATSGTVALTQAQLSMLLEGIDWRRPVRSYQPQMAV